LTGKADINGYIKLLEDITTHEFWQPGSLVLSVETELDTSHFSTGDVKRIAKACGEKREVIGPAKFAAVAEADHIFGINRMWEVYVSDLWDAEAYVFKSKKEALEWLVDHFQFG
jgi:hypothetical protein